MHLTPAEAERLRKVSYERQLAAGMRHPGSAGLTADRLGDAEAWRPPTAELDDNPIKDIEKEKSIGHESVF